MGDEVSNRSWKRDKETQRKESENQPIYHSSFLLTGTPRVREIDVQRARETDPEIEWQRSLSDPKCTCTYAHTRAHAHAHRHIRNGGSQENSEEARRQAGVKAHPTSIPEGLLPPTPSPSPAYHYKGPAGHLHPGALSAWPC